MKINEMENIHTKDKNKWNLTCFSENIGKMT